MTRHSIPRLKWFECDHKIDAVKIMDLSRVME